MASLAVALGVAACFAGKGLFVVSVVVCPAARLTAKQMAFSKGAGILAATVADADRPAVEAIFTPSVLLAGAGKRPAYGSGGRRA